MIKINNNGELKVKTPLGKLIERKPYAYQVINDHKVGVDLHYEIVNREENNYRFNVSEYNTDYLFIIDPKLEYFTFLKGK